MADQGNDAEIPAEDPFAETAEDRQPRAAGSVSGGVLRSNASLADLSGARGGMSEQTRNRIAVQLRAMYDTVAQQPVPDRFAELIAKLDGGKA